MALPVRQRLQRTKGAAYEANWGGETWHRRCCFARRVDLPAHAVDLAWASFPCQDLSLAGAIGTWRRRDNVATRSGTFWAFWWRCALWSQEGRAPRAIVLENVDGVLTSTKRHRFRRLSASALRVLGYRFGALTIDAAHFVPQSRPARVLCRVPSRRRPARSAGLARPAAASRLGSAQARRSALPPARSEIGCGGASPEALAREPQASRVPR